MEKIIVATMEGLKALQKKVPSSEHKNINLIRQVLKKMPTVKGNIFNDVKIYSEACLVRQILMVTNDYRLAKVIGSGKALDVFTGTLTTILNVPPVPLLMAESFVKEYIMI